MPTLQMKKQAQRDNDLPKFVQLESGGASIVWIALYKYQKVTKQ